MPTPLQILHVPQGIDDPYNSQPWERAPREPRAGEVVTVATVTRPAGAVRSLSVDVRSSDGHRFTVAGRFAPWDGEGDRWESTLGAFSAESHVAYSIWAVLKDTEQARAGPYAFDVVGSHRLAAVTSWKVTSGGTAVELSDGAGNESLLTIEAIEAGALRLRVWPVAPVLAREGEQRVPCSAREEDGLLVVSWAHLEVCIGLKDGSLRVRRGGSEVRSPAGQPFLTWLGPRSDCPHAVRVCLALTADEAIYGSGERFDQLDRRGLRFDVRVYEQYKNQGSRTYLPVPLVLSSRGYAISVEGTRPLCIDAGANEKETLALSADVARDRSACLEMVMFVADAPLAALESYLKRAGLPVMPPEWTFGLWMSANDWNSQARVMREVERSEREGIPAEVLVIEAWSDEATYYIWNDAEYAPLPADRPPRLADFRFPPDGRWPDPRGMIEALHAKGMRVLLWQIPLIKPLNKPHAQQSLDEETALSQGWCAHNPDGSPYRNPGWWFTDALVPDLTNPAAVEWWLLRRRCLVEEMGVDGFKTDGGEHLWGREVMFADGRRGDEMINAFPVLYAEVYHRLLKECGHRESLTFSRAGYAGSQRYPAHWAGDENSTWEAFRHSIVAGLSAGASGIPFWGWDIAGFSEEIPSGELYRRCWMMATFCPIMQYHSEYNARREPCRDRTPWNIAERTADPYVLSVCRTYLRVRERLKPYILPEARYTAATGRPLMCALPLAYPNDHCCGQCPYQYLFGRDLLVAPTTEEGAVKQDVYLPAGSWRDLWSTARWEGPQLIVVDVPPDHIPVFVRMAAEAPLDQPWNEMR